MINMFFEDLLAQWKGVFYTAPIVILCSLFAIFFGIKYYCKDKTHTLFIIYSATIFLLFTISDVFKITSPLSKRNMSAIIESANTLLEVIEFFTFYHFFLQIIKSKLVRALMQFSFIILLSLMTLFFIKISDQNFNRTQIFRFSSLIGSVKFFLLLIPLLTYFFEIFNIAPLKDISQSPSLWITSGLFIYCLATLPFLLISGYLYSSTKSLYVAMFSIHYLSLGFLFLTIIKAFTCRKPITT